MGESDAESAAAGCVMASSLPRCPLSSKSGGLLVTRAGAHGRADTRGRGGARGRADTRGRTRSSGRVVKPLADRPFGRMLNKPDEITGMNRIKLRFVVLIDTNV
jgi:hypothetical protein